MHILVPVALYLLIYVCSFIFAHFIFAHLCVHFIFAHLCVHFIIPDMRMIFVMLGLFENVSLITMVLQE